MLGGNLEKSSVFRNILSIGYEFETHELAKLSLENASQHMDNSEEFEEIKDYWGNFLPTSGGRPQPPPPDLNNKIFINSDTTLNALKIMLSEETAIKIDENNVEFIFPNFYYSEYFSEPDPNNKDVVFYITNDIGTSDFSDVLTKECTKWEESDDYESKNALYSIRLPSASIPPIPIWFSPILASSECSNFSGVEWIVTFYSLQPSKNIILETFLNACYHIFDHVNKLTKQPAELVIGDGDGDGGHVIGKDRYLFHLPNTNLYYLPTPDTLALGTPVWKNLNALSLIPQMTFRCSIVHIIDIMKQILKFEGMSKLKRKYKLFSIEYTVTNNISTCTRRLLASFALPNDVRNKITGYLFMILYKLYWFVMEYSLTDGMNIPEHYFKDYLSFASRHSNYEYYLRILSLLPSDISFKQIITQPTILREYFPRKQKIFQFLPPTDPNYGNPSIAFYSYFDFFEHPIPKDPQASVSDLDHEWLRFAKIDVFSTNYTLSTDDTILVENRLFFQELIYFSKQIAKINMTSSATLSQLKRLYKIIINKHNTKELAKFDFNPHTRRFVKKCAIGARDSHFKCRTRRNPRS
jgi:hypothetical protein